MIRTTLLTLCLVTAMAHGLAAQVTFDRLLNADQEPHNWLTYSGTHSSERHSRLDQITAANVGDLELQWVFQAQSLQVFETTPLVVDGIMYLTEAPNTVVALDRRGGARVLDLQAHALLRVATLLWPGESRCCHSRRHLVHGHDRCTADRD